jgi:hypothetical protein
MFYYKKHKKFSRSFLRRLMAIISLIIILLIMYLVFYTETTAPIATIPYRYTPLKE